MKYTIIYIVISSIVFVCGLNAQHVKKSKVLYNKNKKYSIQELDFDLAILRDALIKSHPSLYWYQTEKEFEDNYTLLKNSINHPLTELEFYHLLTPFIKTIRCGHTDIVMSKAFSEYCRNNVKVFPFEIRIIDSKIYISKNFTNDTLFKIGSQIISINGIHADSLLQLMQGHGWGDGYIKSYSRIEIECFLEPFLLYHFNYPEKYILNILDTERHLKRTETIAIDFKSYEKRSSEQVGKVPETKYKNFKFNMIDTLKTGVIKIDAFMGRHYSKFLKSTFKTIKEKSIKNLIIDLRGNGGGEGHYPMLLYSYISHKEFRTTSKMEMTIDDPKDSIFKYGKLPYNGDIRFRYFYKHRLYKTEDGNYAIKSNVIEELGKKPLKPKRNNFKGNVFILTDVKSCSASSHFSAIAHFNKRAACIGRETGGAYCGSTAGWEFLLTLPKTEIQVYIPLFRCYTAVDVSCGRGVEPDHPLKEEINDMIFGKDSDLSFTLNLINQSNR